MSSDNHQQPPVGVPPPQGYPQECGKGVYPPPPPPQYPVQGYPAPQYAQPPPQQQQILSTTGCLQGCAAALCCCCLLGACF